MAQAQRRLFADAGYDIVAVLDAVDESLVARPLGDEILRRARGSSVRTNARAVAAATALMFAVCMGRPDVIQAQQVVDAEVRTALVEAIADSLVGGYIYVDRARVIADSLRSALYQGRFDESRDVAALGMQLTQILRRISNDKHLSVGLTEEAASSPGRVRVRQSAGSSNTPGAATHGLERYEVLPGNVGYIDIRMFSGDPAALLRADSIMAQFANVKALVIDVRQNIGGGPAVIRHLSTYLFDKPTHLVNSFTRGMSQLQERWSSTPFRVSA